MSEPTCICIPWPTSADHDQHCPQATSLLGDRDAGGRPRTSVATEYGVRFLIPHANAGEAVWAPDALYAARMVVDTPGMAELVTRQVGPWTRVIPPVVSTPERKATP